LNDRAAKLSALIIASASSFLTPFMISSLNIALPAIGKEFKSDAVMLSWVATSYLLAAAVSLVPFGKLADIHGRKKIFLSGQIIVAVTSLLAAISVSTPMLIAFRVFQGIGGAMVFATGIAILTSVYPPRERGKVLGIAVTAVYIGLSCGPFFGGWLTQQFSWRSIFLFNLPLGAFIILLVVWKLKGEWTGAQDDRFDLAGSAIYAVAIMAIMYGITIIPSAASIWIIPAGLLGLFGFFQWERRVRYPVFEVNLFVENRTFSFSCLAALINYSATFAVAFLLSLYLQYIKRAVAQIEFYLLTPAHLVRLISGFFSSRFLQTHK